MVLNIMERNTLGWESDESAIFTWNVREDPSHEVTFEEKPEEI